MNNKGFTLVEVISVLAILAIIVTIAFSMTKSTQSRIITKQELIAENEIIAAAKLYVLEKDVKWIDNIEEYSCVSIKMLKESGYFKERDIDDYNDSFVKVIRNKDTKVITNEIIKSNCN